MYSTVALIALLWVPSAIATVIEPQPLGGRSIERVRTTNQRIAAALREGHEKAGSFRILLDELQRSDVILHIEVGECTCRIARSCLTFVSRSGSARYLRATVSLRQIQRELIAQIGHELFHASEIARAAEVTSRQALVKFYAREGRRTCGRPCGFETAAAVRLEARLRTELTK